MKHLYPFPSDVRIEIRANDERRDARLPENHPAAIMYPGTEIKYPYPYNKAGLMEYENMFSTNYFEPDVDNQYESKIAIQTRKKLEMSIDGSRKEGWLTPIGGRDYFSKLHLILTTEDTVLDLRRYDHYFKYLIACGQSDLEIAKSEENRNNARFYMMDMKISEDKQNKKTAIQLAVFRYITANESNRYKILLLKSMIETTNHFLSLKTSTLVSELLQIATTTPVIIYDNIKDEEALKYNELLQVGIRMGYIKQQPYEYIYKNTSYKKQQMLDKIKQLYNTENDNTIKAWIGAFKEKYVTTA